MIVTAETVHLTGDGIKDAGIEPEVHARLYQVTAPSFTVKIEGTGAVRERQAAPSPDEDPGQPKTTEILAKVYDRMYWILGLTFAILALGGTLLFRKGTA